MAGLQRDGQWQACSAMANGRPAARWPMAGLLTSLIFQITFWFPKTDWQQPEPSLRIGREMTSHWTPASEYASKTATENGGHVPHAADVQELTVCFNDSE
jgi:hypothetical protein